MNPSHPLSGHRFRHALLLATWVACAVPAWAQIVADPSAPGAQRPTVLTAPNGVPLVNITTPSAAGVSRNTYRQFDVAPSGVILNNSRSDAPTQQGGWVQGNPWLAAGGARVIVNEVNASQPSQLNGWVEVAGQRAEVVIANPAGIEVNGGGFINASRATLSTGAPVFSGGALEGFRVQGGRVRVEGLGLDATQSDHLTILTRAIEVNAGIWAQAITGVSGTNEVSADGSTVRPITPASGAAPSFALDVAAVGGMYAGKIFLIGTEAGLGVNQQGLIDARGALTLDVNGWLSHTGGARTYGDTVDIRAQGVRNEGGSVIAGRAHLAIEAGTIHNSEGALLLSGGDMALAANERLENRSAAIEALGSLSISTPVLINANDHFETELVEGTPTRYLRLRHQGVDYTLDQLGANFTQLDAYVNEAHWRVLLPSATYPFEQFPALSASWASAAGPFELGSTRQPESCFGESCFGGLIEPYGPGHIIWARFGVASPGEPPSGSDPLALAAYEDLKRVQQDRLDERIAAYNADVRARTLRDWTIIDATQTPFEPRVLRSEPGRIAAGERIDIAAGEVHNDKSTIVAGGVLQVLGTTLVNTDAEVTARTELSGEAVYSWFRDDCGLCHDDRKYVHTPYSASLPHTVNLPLARAEGQASDAPSSLPAGASSALYASPTDPSSPFLLETDPRFTDQRQWLGSEYLLRALAVDPATVQKRLGDGYIEQRLIQEQVGTLTGRRYLGDFTSDEQQYLALMEAGATFAHAQGLRPGIALSPEQVAALTSDVVWLVGGNGRSSIQEDGSLVGAQQGDASAAPPAPVVSGGTANAATLPALKTQLAAENLANIAAQDARLAKAATGSGTSNPNFAIGSGTAEEADRLGRIWVGDGARSLTGVPGGMISADGTRVYRPPTAKPNAPSHFNPTGVQANFQTRNASTGVVVSNGHMVIK